MSLDGFLQIISPYVRADDQLTFAELFVNLINRNFFPPNEILTLDDFKMFIDNHHSIRHSDPQYIRQVIKKVKDAVDNNLTYEERQKQIAYEVQKILSNPDLKIDDRRDKKIKQQTSEITELGKKIEENERKHTLKMQEVETNYSNEISELKDSISGIESDYNILQEQRDRDGKTV